MAQSDADLANSIMLESMLAGPTYGGAGALLAMAATSRERGGRVTFEIIHPAPPETAAVDTPRPAAGNGLPPPVHLVAYLYARSNPPSSEEAQHRHLTTLEFLLLSVDDATYSMRERQVRLDSSRSRLVAN